MPVIASATSSSNVKQNQGYDRPELEMKASVIAQQNDEQVSLLRESASEFYRKQAERLMPSGGGPSAGRKKSRLEELFDVDLEANSEKMMEIIKAEPKLASVVREVQKFFFLSRLS